MTQIEGHFKRDANGVPIASHGLVESKSVVFAGGTANNMGDYDGTGNPYTLFTVTGDVLVQIFGYCTVNLAGGSATLEIGITANTAGLIAQSTATDIDAGTVWIDATPASIQALPDPQILVGGTDIIQTAGTANITSGAITYYCLWYPLSETGNVVAA